MQEIFVEDVGNGTPLVLVHGFFRFLIRNVEVSPQIIISLKKILEFDMMPALTRVWK